MAKQKTAAQILAEQKALAASLLDQAKAQREVSESLDAYLAGLKKAKNLNQTINDNNKLAQKIKLELQEAANKNDVKAIELALLKLKLLNKETRESEKKLTILSEQLKTVNRANIAISKMGASALKGMAQLPGLIQNSYGKLKGYGLFEMDKAIKTSALQMGLLGKESKSYSDIIRQVALDTNDLGIGAEELAKTQAAYTDELGRNVMLGKEGLKSMAAIAAATGLGAEGTAKMAADLENQGYSAEHTRDFVEQTMNDAHKMGLNASKVIKNIQSNIKMLNKYNFKGGVKGLAKMAETATKLGVDMNVAAGMADKLFDIEGAVDMSSQLQVMGGEWSKLADPFKLMYMARNDMEGLTEALGKAAESSVHFNKENQDFEISALEMHRLRKVAEQTGVAYEDLATMGKNAAKFTKIKTQLSFDTGSGKDGKAMQDFIASTAQFEDGKAFVIDVNGDKKFLKDLGQSGKELIKSQMLAKASLEERAKASQTFDDKLTNLINMVKTTMLPIIDGIDSVLGPLVNDLLKSPEFKKQLTQLGKDIAGFVKFGAEVVKWIAKAAIWLGPGGTLMTILGTKGILSAASWFMNGLSLAKGFNMGTGGMGGSSPIGGSRTQMGSPMNKKMMRGVKAGGIASIIGMAGGMANDAGVFGEEGSTGHQVAGVASQALSMGGTGAMIGSMIFPGIGTAVGGVLGAIAGGLMGAYDEGLIGKGKADRNVYNPPVEDAMFEGTGIIKGGKITPIDNKDDLMAYKPNGVIDNAMKGNANGSMKIEFGEIHFKFDELKVTSPGSPGIAIDLLKDPQFIRNVTRMVHSETQKVINGGMNKA